jgi:hypothetical protein
LWVGGTLARRSCFTPHKQLHLGLCSLLLAPRLKNRVTSLMRTWPPSGP